MIEARPDPHLKRLIFKKRCNGLLKVGSRPTYTVLGR